MSAPSQASRLGSSGTEAASVGVVGGGEFGRSLALAVARSAGTVLHYSRAANPIETPAGGGVVHSTSDLAALRDASLLFLAVPSPIVDDLATRLDAHLDGRHMLVHVSRGLAALDDGLEAPALVTLSERLRALTACRRVGALAGPLVPESLATTIPGGAVIGTPFPEVAAAVRAALGGPSMRLYDTPDLLGVELASASVGVLAIAVGIAQGLDVGPGALAVLCTRGMSEATRLGVKMGASTHTFAGLAGFGDLVACVAGDGRAELLLGQQLARGTSVSTALEQLGVHVEGVRLAPRMARFAELTNVQAPILAAIAGLVGGTLGPEAALASLMARIVHKE
ncbi:MAG: NAD(P)-binding domain-containing protein [Sandaracinaceae bacterium]|nr:NAD(P)-binding domain-containing protein [Sandaracinaceae bacterium]